MAMISPLTTPADGRSLHAYGTRWRGLHAGRLGGLVAASAPKTARTSVRPRCYSESRTPPPGAGPAPGAAHRTCDRSLQTTCRHTSGGGVHFSVHRPTTPARDADRR